MEKVSVIVPVYNVENYICQCLESILSQKGCEIEVILVDDGATDSSGYICDSYAKKDRRVRVIHKKNGGLSDARNAGLEVATGKYIAFVDSDDYISDNCFSTLYNNLVENDADISIGSFQYVYDGEDDIINSSNNVIIWNVEETLHHMLLQRKITTSVWGVLSKRNYWESIKFPVGKLYEDMGTSYKIYTQAQKIVYTSQIVYYYRMREKSIQNTVFSIQKMDEIKFAMECKAFVEDKYPNLKQEATNRLVSCSFHTLFSMKKFEEAPKESMFLMNIIRRYRKQLIFGRNVNKKVRFGCLCTYVGFAFTHWIYNKLGMRGRINL